MLRVLNMKVVGSGEYLFEWKRCEEDIGIVMYLSLHPKGLVAV